MAIVRHFRASDGSTLIPVTGGAQEFILYDLSGDLKEHYFFVAFVDASGNAQTPSAGTVTLEGAPSVDPLRWDAIPDGSFDAADADSQARTRPVAAGPLNAARLRLNGVTGADFVVARVTGY